MKNKIQIELPKNFMNCGVTVDNYLTADTNNSANWDILKFPLPKPEFKWKINRDNGKIIELIDTLD